MEGSTYLATPLPPPKSINHRGYPLRLEMEAPERKQLVLGAKKHRLGKCTKDNRRGFIENDIFFDRTGFNGGFQFETRWQGCSTRWKMLKTKNLCKCGHSWTMPAYSPFFWGFWEDYLWCSHFEWWLRRRGGLQPGGQHKISSVRWSRPHMLSSFGDNKSHLGQYRPSVPDPLWSPALLFGEENKLRAWKKIT